MNHLSGAISLKMRVFLNPSSLWEYAAWYFCSEQRSYLASEPNYPKGLCLSHFYDTTRPSPTPQTHTAVCAAELISGGPLRCRFPGVPQSPWAAFFPHHGCSMHSAHKNCVSSFSATQGRLQGWSERVRFKPLLHLFCFTTPCFPFLQ